MPLVNFTNLDFNQIKDSLRDYLRANSNFTDYDYEGSNLSTIIDILAYNTYLNSYNANMVTNVDDKITNPFKTDEYSDSLALRMMKKLDVQDDEYVSSAQLHMQDRFRKDIMSESESESEFEPSESFVEDATKKKNRKR